MKEYEEKEIQRMVDLISNRLDESRSIHKKIDELIEAFGGKDLDYGRYYGIAGIDNRGLTKKQFLTLLSKAIKWIV